MINACIGAYKTKFMFDNDRANACSNLSSKMRLQNLTHDNNLLFHLRQTEKTKRISFHEHRPQSLASFFWRKIIWPIYLRLVSTWKLMVIKSKSPIMVPRRL